ncbi:MAG TPA: phosphoribosylanthranilate isomerase [Candidatus Acidoferrales bacterium]|jgi:phosphoribosylanthranilate isomerase|nr:phosphoribosylanthranilate isomerase [Candidatus Acidoferrales bacterium]
MSKVKVKICGITNWVDARRAVAEGAELLGFNFYARSPRYVAPAKAKRIVSRLPKQILVVGVFVNESEQKMLEIARVVGLDALQLHGDETPAMVARLKRSFPVIKAIRVKASAASTGQMGRFKQATALLLDGFDAQRRGGTAKTFDWEIARRAKKHGRIFLAGGLTPENVGAAIRTARPYAVDVCSGVEARPGKKDPARMKNLMRAARDAQKSPQKSKRSA